MTASTLYGMPPGLSDDHARRTIEFCVPTTVEGGVMWSEMEAVADGYVDAVTDALLWLEERGDTTEGFRVVRHPHRPSLIRFEVRP